MLPNWITLSRLPVLAINVVILYRGTPHTRLVGVGLLFIGLMLDTVDGIVARRTGQTSLFGSVLDIAADRMYELVLWVCFAHFGMIPPAIPLIVIARTTLTDAFRSVGVAQGKAPFEQHSGALGRFLVGSPWMKVGYQSTKIMAFCGLALVRALGASPPGSLAAATGAWLFAVSQIAAWTAVVLCLVRGLPVVMHGLRQLQWSRRQRGFQGGASLVLGQ